MKIKNILFVSLFAGAVLSSCDYTDLSPIDSITDKTYWTTTNDLKLYANGLYNLTKISKSISVQSDIAIFRHLR